MSFIYSISCIKLIIILSSSLTICVHLIYLTALENDSERENPDRQQNIDLEREEIPKTPPGIGSMFGLPKWITQNWQPPRWLSNFLSPFMGGFGGGTGAGNVASAVSEISETVPLSSAISEVGEFTNIWMRAQDFIDRIGNAKTADDRLRHVLGWVLLNINC